MKLNNIILIPTDFSEVCHNAIDHGVKIAESQKGMKVCIYHVINKDTHAYFKGVDNLNQSVQGKLQGLIDEFHLNHNVEMEYAYEDGNIFDLIYKKADEIGANFIILGTHGKKGLQYLLGSYALKVLSKAEVPTLVVQNKEYVGYKNVLFPINTFTEARQKVGIATRVAHRFDSTIHIFKEKVNDPADMSRIEIISKQIVDEFKREKVNYTIHNAEKSGDSAKQLIDFAASNSMDLVMILTEPQIGTTYFNLGPWNEKIMFNDAQIPVFCINPVEHSQVYFSL
ncbi:MAG: universal stress protein [Bacteroidales bacterium]|nr:universal stress protein [Bacteroidales bacterium]